MKEHFVFVDDELEKNDIKWTRTEKETKRLKWCNKIDNNEKKVPTHLGN